MADRPEIAGVDWAAHDAGRQPVVPTATDGGVKDLCAYHGAIAKSHADYANEQLGDLLGDEEHAELGHPKLGQCDDCARMVSRRPSGGPTETEERGPTVPFHRDPDSPGARFLRRHDEARERQRQQWRPSTEPITPLPPSLNARTAAKFRSLDDVGKMISEYGTKAEPVYMHELSGMSPEDMASDRYEPSDLHALVHDVQRRGVQRPIQTWTDEQGREHVYDGHHRYWAAAQAGLGNVLVEHHHSRTAAMESDEERRARIDRIRQQRKQRRRIAPMSQEELFSQFARPDTPEERAEAERQRQARVPKPEPIDDREYSLKDVDKHYGWEGFGAHEISHLVKHPEKATFTHEDVPVHSLRLADEHGNLKPAKSYSDIAEQGEDEQERLHGLEDADQVPPIVVVRHGEHHIIADGSHRAAIAAQRGDSHIPAFVTERTIMPKHGARAFDAYDPNQVYLRFGRWPKDERSHNNVTGWKEDGVSVYDLDHKGEPEDPDPNFGRIHQHDEHCEPYCDLDEDETYSGLNDTREEMEGRVRRAERTRYNGSEHPSDVGHLVRGDMIGVGHDGEPLLNNVRRVGDWIDHRHLFVPGAPKHHLARDPDDEDYEPPEESPKHTAAKYPWTHERYTPTGYETVQSELEGPLYHGSRSKRLKPGDLITPGRKTNPWGDEGPKSKWVHFTTDHDNARGYADEAGGHVYEVEPTGDFQMGYHGTEYKTTDPLRVIRRVEHEKTAGRMDPAITYQGKIRNKLNINKGRPLDEWYHGTTANFDRFAEPGTVGKTTHWNTALGPHFTENEKTAAMFGQGENGEPGRIIHAELHMKNPKVYAHEHDMDKAAFDHEYDRGTFADSKNQKMLATIRQERKPNMFTGHHMMAVMSNHPDAAGIGARFKQRLEDAGHDGVVYNKNAIEGGQGRAVIAFHPEQIDIKSAHPYDPNAKRTPGDPYQCNSGQKTAAAKGYIPPAHEIYWHGTPSGDLRGGDYGLHVGTREAARQALTANIGHPVEGDWDGTREYGKTLLAGKRTLRERGIYPTGYSMNAPEEDHYPNGKGTYGNGKTPVPMHMKPDLFPVRIVGEMSNTPWWPHDDAKANGLMKGNLKRGTARRGYYYTNVGEDSGSVSAVLPGPGHVERVPRTEENHRNLGGAKKTAARAVRCLIKHEGPCPPIGGKTAMPSRKHAEPEGFDYEIEPHPAGTQQAPTHRLKGMLNGEHVGSIDFSKSDDGNAVNVHSLHTYPGAYSKGIASAMMDRLYAAHPHAWINHGERTADGVKWWAQYQDPDPSRNVHLHQPSSGWGEYFHPRRISMDMADNWTVDPEHNTLLSMKYADYPEPERTKGGIPKPMHGPHWENWRHGRDVAKTAAIRDSAEMSGEDIHRGFATVLPDRLANYVHDDSQPVDARARALREHLSRQPLGMHWSDDPEVADSFAHDAMTNWHPDGMPNTKVMLHAAPPRHEDIETDPDRLESGAVNEDDEDPESEYPLRRNAPLRVKGISWTNGVTPWKRHRFEEPWHHVASKTAAADDDEHGDSYTDWDQHYPTFHEVHRGMAVHLPPDLHERAHNRDPDDEDDDDDRVAHDIIKHLSGQPLGQHWTADRNVARRFADDSTWMAHNPEHGTPVTHVVLTAHKPAREHIETDQDKIDAIDDAPGGVQPFDTGAGSEREVPLKSGTPLHVKHIEWSHQGTRMHPYGGEHDSDVEENIEPYVGPMHVHAVRKTGAMQNPITGGAAIAFDPDQIETTQRHHPDEPCKTPHAVERERNKPMPGQRELFHANLRKKAHDSGDSQRIFHCFAGETRYLTPEGVKTLAETAGTEQHVMTGGTETHGGRWVHTRINELGQQPLLRVTLQRNKQTKVIRATAEHRWLVTTGPQRDRHRVVTTAELRKDHRLAHLRLPRFAGEPDHDGIRMGAVFGDGTILRHDSRTYGVITLWGAKRDLAKYFDEIVTGIVAEPVTDDGVPGLRYTSGMAGYTKELPPLTAAPEYLLGWLMGYIAADGYVSDAGQVTLSSASLENLLHVRDVATRLGIGTYAPTSKLREGYSGASVLHQVGFSAADLGVDFFLRDDQRARIREGKREAFGWIVRGVEDLGEVETVYCPSVPVTESFVLDDNVHTGNCPFDGSGQVIARSDGSAECEFCHTAFTVQVQPMYSGFPQTINGMPVQIPGMPGQIDAPGTPATGGGSMPPGLDDSDGGDDDGGGFLPGGDDDQSSSDDADSDDSGSSDSKPPWLKGSALLSPQSLSEHFYATAAGDVLPEDAYVRHMAIACAPDRAEVLARLRRQKEMADGRARDISNAYVMDRDRRNRRR